jgi:hypothetical protein
MVWALIAILGQGVILLVALAMIKSLGAFTSSLETFTSTFLAAHNENAIMRSGTTDLIERIERVDRHIRRATETLSDRSFGIPPHPPHDQEKSA